LFDDGFPEKLKPLASNTAEIKTVVIDDLYCFTVVHISQKDVIHKDIIIQLFTLDIIITTTHTISGLCDELIHCKGKGTVVNVHAMKVYGGVEVQFCPLSWTKDGGK
jgi:hypothetical protein